MFFIITPQIRIVKICIAWAGGFSPLLFPLKSGKFLKEKEGIEK